MRHQKRKFTLDRDAAGRTALIRSLATNLIERGAIHTTPARAKAVQQFIEPLVTIARTGKTVTTHRHIIARLGGNRKATTLLLTRVAPVVLDRAGGYTRRIKILPRKGDNASQVRLEWTVNL